MTKDEIVEKLEPRVRAVEDYKSKATGAFYVLYGIIAVFGVPAIGLLWSLYNRVTDMRTELSVNAERLTNLSAEMTRIDKTIDKLDARIDKLDTRIGQRLDVKQTSYGSSENLGNYHEHTGKIGKVSATSITLEEVYGEIKYEGTDIPSSLPCTLSPEFPGFF